jgi:hypothetical protein
VAAAEVKFWEAPDFSRVSMPPSTATWQTDGNDR